MTPEVSRHPETKPDAAKRGPATHDVGEAGENEVGTPSGSRSIRTNCVRALNVWRAWDYAIHTGLIEEADELEARWRKLAGIDR